ncbi:MAG: hypothetical protein K0S60_748 [Evtepia sp.]|jgi:hypothetical protein|nr:hypothetical protein [Evtepia sp.]
MKKTQFILCQQFSSEEETQRKETFSAILTEYFRHANDDPFPESHVSLGSVESTPFV